jgi:predicted  nucleic acid-binding Zn-ribbon protein
MDESEATKFIADEVSKLLWQRLLLIASLFGIANVIAFVSLWRSITDDAHKVAEDQVKKSATEYAEKALDKFTEITTEAKKRIADLDADYATLYKSIGSMTADLTQLQSSEKSMKGTLEDFLSQSAKVIVNVTNESDKLISDFSNKTAKAFENLQGSETRILSQLQVLSTPAAEHAVEVINAIKDLRPDQKQIVDSLSQLSPRLDKLASAFGEFKTDLAQRFASINSDLESKVSISSHYRIQSVQGAFWIAVNQAALTTTASTAIMLGDRNHPQSEGEYWHFVLRSP